MYSIPAELNHRKCCVK